MVTVMAVHFYLHVLLILMSAIYSLHGESVLDVSGPQDEASHEEDRRLLLNDPQTILTQLEATQREMQTLKALMNTQQTKLQSMDTLVNSQKTTIQSMNTLVNSQQTQIQTLETLVNTQQTKIQTQDNLINAQQTKIQSIQPLETVVNTQKTKLQTLDTLVNSQQSQIQSFQNQLTKTANQGLGATYTVWGRKQCPALNGTTTVYSGISAGSPFDHGGGAANTLCVTHNPDHPPTDFPTSTLSNGVLYGSEYEFSYRNYALNDDVPCAVCLATYSTAVLMIPSKTSCPSGWTEEYHGFLTSQSATDGRPQYEYLCLHENAEYMTEGARQHDDNGRIFYPVKTQCGSLPCPPYINAKYVTCVVCSM